MPFSAPPDPASDDGRPVLVLGATGTTGSRVVDGLRSSGTAVRAASRAPRPAADPGVEPVAFDWDAPETHGPALAGSRAVYLLPPLASMAPDELVLPFVERARRAGVERVVLLSASPIAEGDAGLGRVHAALRQSGGAWAVLRPTWFTQNLVNPAHHVGSAFLAGRELVTATGSGRIAFVDAADIAAVAVRALLDPVPHDDEHVITGPEALSYDDVARLLAAVSGRDVRHRAAAPDEVADLLAAAGVPAAFAAVLAGMETAIAAGSEDRVTDTVMRVTGRPARDVRAVLETALVPTTVPHTPTTPESR